MTTAFSTSMPPGDVESFLSQIRRPSQDDRPMPRRHDHHIHNQATARFSPDHDHDDNATFPLARMVRPPPPTDQELLAKHIRLTTVYDPLHPPPDDEVTREGTVLGLRPDTEDRLFHHQTLRLGRWCGMIGQHVERDELLEFEKELLDWKFERPAPRRRVPSKEAAGRGCMGNYLRRRKTIPRHEILNRRPRAEDATAPAGSKWPQARSATSATAGMRPGSISKAAASLSLPTPKTSRRTIEKSSRKRTVAPVPISPSALAATRRAMRSVGDSTTSQNSKPESPTSKQQQRQQANDGLPPRFLLPDGRVNISKVIDGQMEFIASGGEAEQFFAKYPGLQEMMDRPNKPLPRSNAPRPTARRPFTQPTPQSDTIRRARITEVDAAGNEASDKDKRAEESNPIFRQTKRGEVSGATTFFSSSSSSRAARRTGGSGFNSSTAAAKSRRRLAWKPAGAAKRNVTWAPLPDEENENDEEEADDAVEISRDQVW